MSGKCTPPMRVLDLFSGIGGFSLGLDRAGMETVAFCEQDEFCHDVLAKHWPDVPLYTDVREITATRLERDGVRKPQLICGGFPCQPFSNIGEQRGSEDDRHLWPEMYRIIREVEPHWVIGENVTGIVGMELDQVLLDLESLGYSCGALIIPACALNARHRRDRVWILAHSMRLGLQRRDLEGEEGWWDEGCRLPPLVDPQDWRDLCRPRVGGDSNGLPRRVDTRRLKALGNAVVPGIVEVIGRAIMRISNAN